MNKLHLIKLFGLALLVLALVAGGWFLGVRAVSAQDEGPLDDPEWIPYDPTGVEAAVPGGPGYFMSPGSQLKPALGSMNYEVAASKIYNRSTDTTKKTFYAPIHLPNGATIEKFTVYFYDNYSTENISGYLETAILPGTSGGTLASVSTDLGTSTSARYMSTTSIAQGLDVVDNSQNVYYVRILMPVSQNVYVQGIRVDYGYTTTIPLTMR